MLEVYRGSTAPVTRHGRPSSQVVQEISPVTAEMEAVTAPVYSFANSRPFPFAELEDEKSPTTRGVHSPHQLVHEMPSQQ